MLKPTFSGSEWALPHFCSPQSRRFWKPRLLFLGCIRRTWRFHLCPWRSRDIPWEHKSPYSGISESWEENNCLSHPQLRYILVWISRQFGKNRWKQATQLHWVIWTYIETSFPYTLSVSICHRLRQCPPELLAVEVGYELFEEGLVHLEERLAQDDKLSSGLFLCDQLGRIIMNANFGNNFSTSDGVLAGLAKRLVNVTGP